MWPWCKKRWFWSVGTKCRLWSGGKR